MGSLSSSKRISVAISMSSVAKAFSRSSSSSLRDEGLTVVVLPWLFPSLKARLSEQFGDVLRAFAFA